MRFLPLIGAVSVVALATTAFAVPSAPASKMDTDSNGVVSKTEAMTAADTIFVKMDKNSDGTLNAADREAGVKLRFQEMDGDKNGSVTEAEFVAAHQDRMEERQAKWTERGGRGDHDGHRGGKDGKRGGGHHGGMGGGMALVKMADTDGDMSVTKAEFEAAAESRFTKADTDKNGSLSADEQKAARKAMRAERSEMPPAAAPAV